MVTDNKQFNYHNLYFHTNCRLVFEYFNNDNYGESSH